MWQYISKLVSHSLELYQTTLAEDKELLTSKDLTLNHRNCLLLRSGEKEILHFFLEMSDKMIKLIKLNRREIMKASLQSEFVKYNNYINRILVNSLL